MAMKTFEHTWRRSGHWGVAFVGPDGPVLDSTPLSEWLQEANGLARAGRQTEALTAFHFAARHWPDAGAPYISAANILIETNRMQDAKILLHTACNASRKTPWRSITWRLCRCA